MKNVGCFYLASEQTYKVNSFLCIWHFLKNVSFNTSCTSDFATASSCLDFLLGLKVLFFLVSLQLCGFPLMPCRLYKAVTEILLGWVTGGNSFNLPTVLGMFILNVFPISTLCVRTDPWALITQKGLHLTFSQTPLQAYVFPKWQL